MTDSLIHTKFVSHWHRCGVSHFYYGHLTKWCVRRVAVVSNAIVGTPVWIILNWTAENEMGLHWYWNDGASPLISLSFFPSLASEARLCLSWLPLLRCLRQCHSVVVAPGLHIQTLLTKGKNLVTHEEASTVAVYWTPQWQIPRIFFNSSHLKTENRSGPGRWSNWWLRGIRLRIMLKWAFLEKLDVVVVVVAAVKTMTCQQNQVILRTELCCNQFLENSPIYLVALTHKTRFVHFWHRSNVQVYEQWWWWWWWWTAWQWIDNGCVLSTFDGL